MHIGLKCHTQKRESRIWARVINPFSTKSILGSPALSCHKPHDIVLDALPIQC